MPWLRKPPGAFPSRVHGGSPIANSEPAAGSAGLAGARTYTRTAMARRFRSARLWRASVRPRPGGAGWLAGCSSDAQQTSDAAVSRDADFSVCQDTPAVAYKPGIKVRRPRARTWPRWIRRSPKDAADHRSRRGARTSWVVSTHERRRWTPGRRHDDGGAADDALARPRGANFPMVTPGDPASTRCPRSISSWRAYWEMKLDLQPASGTADKAVFAICVPQ